MHLEPGLLLLPYTNRWRKKPLGHKVTYAGALLVMASGPWPWPVSVLAGLAAGALAVATAGIRLHTWAELLAPPLTFAVVSAVIVEWGGGGGWTSVARVFGAASATLLFGVTTPILDLVSALQTVRGLKTLADLVFLTYRAITVVGGAGMAMVTAAKVRDLGRRWQRAPRFYGEFSGALAIRALEKARRSEAGMAARGLHGRLPLLRCEECD